MPARLNPDASSSRKMIELYFLLLISGKKYTLTSLAEIIQCSKTTIERLISEIETVDTVELGKDGKERWFQIKRLAKNKNIPIMYQNIMQLAFCKDISTTVLPNTLKDELQGAITHVANLISDDYLKDLSLKPIGRSFSKGQVDYTPFQSIITMLMQAIPKKKLCDVAYYSPKSDSIKNFLIAPMRLLSYHGSLYIECWRIKQDGDEEIIQPMTLAVHRIEVFNPTRRKHTFSEPPQNIDGDFGLIKSGKINVTARFDGTVSTYVKERTWSDDQKITFLPDGALELNFTASNEEEVISWILSFGNHAELISPTELRCKIQNTLNLAIKQYNINSSTN